MLYAIICQDVPNSAPLRAAARPAHLERLEALVAEGRVIIGGPHPAIDSEEPGPDGFTGSLIVAEFGSLDEAQAWADADPYVEGGVFADVSVKPLKRVFP